MRHRVFDLGHGLTQPFAHLIEISDPRHDVEDLTTAVALAHDGFADRYWIVGHHKRAHCQPVDRRRCDDAHLAHPRQRQLQGARYRRRGQCQDMHIDSELLQLLLLHDAKMLLLIDDQEAQMGEPNILGEERMRADDDVDPPLGELLLDFACLFCGDQPRDLCDP